MSLYKEDLTWRRHAPPDLYHFTSREMNNMKNAMKNSLTLLAAILAASWATPAAAQVESGRHWISGFVGGQLFDVSDQFDDFAASFQTELNVGARYQYNFTPHWGAEGSFLYSPGNTELIRAPIDTDVNVDSYYYSGNVVYNFLPAKKFVPFATGGVGAVSLDVSGGNTENYLTFNFGGGALYRLSPRIMVRFDVRDYVYTVDSLGAGSVEALSLPTNFDETIHDLSLNGGVTFAF